MQNAKTKKLVGIALLVAAVVVLQMLGSFIKFGPFSISLVLIPIVVGSALYGPIAGATLGFVFSCIVLATDAGLFLAYSPIGTVITVLAKGTAAGYVSGWLYNKLSGKNESLAAIVAAIAAPVVNTGLFVVGCFVFFVPLLETWAGGANVAYFIIFGMIGTNFLVELAINAGLSSVITRLIHIGKK